MKESVHERSLLVLHYLAADWTAHLLLKLLGKEVQIYSIWFNHNNCCFYDCFYKFVLLDEEEHFSI